MPDEMMSRDEHLEPLRDIEIDPEMLRPADDDNLVMLLESEARNARDYYSLEDSNTIDGMDYYLASRNYRNYTRADEKAYTSKMVSRSVAESVDNLMPDMLRTLKANDFLVEFEGSTAEEAMQLRAVTEAVNATFRAQRDFDDHLHDFIKDGLIMRCGVMEIVVLNSVIEPEVIGGLMQDSLQLYAQRPDVERVEMVGEPSESGAVTIKIWRRRPRQFRIEAIPPTELLISPEARSLDQSTVDGPRYCAIRKEMTVASAIRQWPEQSELWLKVAMDESSQLADIDETFHSEVIRQMEVDRGDWIDDQLQDKNLYQVTLTIYREYYRADMDGDGYPELMQILRVGKYIIHREPVHDNPFAHWTPYPIQHRFWGEGDADKCRDLQDYETSFWRISNDGAAMAAMPRIFVDGVMANQHSDVPTIEDLMLWEPGVAVRTAGPPNQAVQIMEVGDVTTPAMKMLEYADHKKEAWTGVSNRSKGLDPEAVANESGVKFDKIRDANSGRKEFLARQLAQGIMVLGSKMVSFMSRYGDPISVKIDGQWQMVNPIMWSDSLKPIVHISAAVGSRDMEIQNANMVIQHLGAFQGQAGPLNPWVKLDHVAEAIRELLQTLGYRDFERFIDKPPQQAVQAFIEGLKNQKDPQQLIAEMEAKIEEKKLDLAAQTDQYRLDIQKVTEAGRIEVEMLGKAAEIASKERIETAKINQDRREHEDEMVLERDKIEADLEKAEMQAEASARRANTDGASA